MNFHSLLIIKFDTYKFRNIYETKKFNFSEIANNNLLHLIIFNETRNEKRTISKSTQGQY